MVVDGKPDEGAGNQASGDVEDLVTRLRLDGLQYREFSARRPAALELAGGREVPVAPVQKPPAVVIARPREAPRTTAQDVPAVNRELTTPVNSAFERLRRQVIGTRGDAVVLSLRLPLRPVSRPAGVTLLDRPLAEVMVQLAVARPRSPLSR